MTRTPETSDWQFWIDRGGTFTDIVARAPDGRLLSHKVLSEHPERRRDAALQGIRDLLGLAEEAPLPDHAIAAVKMGTTVATNALLERTGEPTVFVTTAGLGDLPAIGDQSRPELFALAIERPEPLHDRVIEVDERLDAEGRVVRPLDEADARARLAAARSEGYRACAIALLHGHHNPVHEQRLAALAEAAGFTQISVSHTVSPLIRLLSRAETTVVDAYLSPVLRRYVDRIAAELGETRLRFMKSDGGLVDAARFRGRDAILSGPAGGIVGCVETARRAGFERVIGFDMGGTSTDVAHHAGELERTVDTTINGVRLRVPMLTIHTVAAGGGSLLQFDGSRYRVGPESAGAHPGPAGYRRGGPLTVTDANIMLGKLQPDFFPAVFGPHGDQPLDAAAVTRGFEALAATIHAATGDARTPEEVAAGFLAIAVENMAGAIKTITTRRGHDPADYLLNCFGGAGGQHACPVADALGMDRVLIHPLAGVLSAYGMGLAALGDLREEAVEEPLDEALVGRLETRLAALEAAGRRALDEQGATAGRIEVEHRARLRYAGSDTALTVPFGPRTVLEEAFTAAHEQAFGFAETGRTLLVEALEVECRAMETDAEVEPESGVPDGGPPPDLPEPLAWVATFMDGRWHRATPVHERTALAPGLRLSGPAIIRDPVATVVVEPDWQATVEADGALLLARVVPRPRREALATRVDPVQLEIFNNRFAGVAEQMGTTLARTAHSANIKERLDFSCALFDGAGNLVANAPHVPVHLGSMGESVRAILASRGTTMAPGDVYLINDPYRGGTHLPDITVVTPVFDADGSEPGATPRFLVANRAHHADVGGSTPGSMPPDSRHIDDEGLLIRDVRAVAGGVFQEAALRDLFGGGPHPARNVDQNLADLRAQIAANQRGVHELHRLTAHCGTAVVEAYMGHVQDNAAEQVRRVLERLPSGHWRTTMDNGAAITVAVRVDPERRAAVIDFTGTDEQRPDNFNAPLAVTRAAVLYVLRCLVDDAIPLNDGCLQPVELVLPEGCLLNPRPPAAVVAGNVEVSQVVTDALFAALGVLANGPGTMNNVTFGNGDHQHYETLCGGAGAGDGFPGADAVHVHMTNSRLTDPEILETRFPVRLDAFAIRRGSGGSGRWRGGDGIERRLTFLEPMTVALLANSRRVAPSGLNGGGDGLVGEQWVERADGRVEPLAGCDRAEMGVGDVFVIRTPGGGGFGSD